MPKQGKLFDIRHWVPYQMWRLSQEAGYILEEEYSVKYNIRGESWRFMAMLASSAPVSAKKLGELLDMDQVQVTRALNKLLDNGYVTRRTDPKDRRKVILTLSTEGAEVYQAIVVMAMELEQKFLGEIPQEEQKLFRNILTGLLDNMDSIRGGPKLF
ncbi:MAG: MarR family transcriptional regulator [Emcibacter sp.]|nr:MarR family transcriptional regulator [Emcibacter sp.]